MLYSPSAPKSCILDVKDKACNIMFLLPWKYRNQQWLNSTSVVFQLKHSPSCCQQSVPNFGRVCTVDIEMLWPADAARRKAKGKKRHWDSTSWGVMNIWTKPQGSPSYSLPTARAAAVVSWHGGWMVSKRDRWFKTCLDAALYRCWQPEVCYLDTSLELILVWTGNRQHFLPHLIILEWKLIAQGNGCRNMTPSTYRLVPFNLAFCMPFGLPPGWIFARKNGGRVTAQRKPACHCATRTGRDIVFPGHGPEIMVD